MSDPRFSEIKACVFDAYGTLFDVHSAAAHMKDDLGEKSAEMSDLWRLKQLQYTWLRSLMGTHVDFWQVTGDALDYAMRALDMEDASLRAKLMELYLQLDAYPEVTDVLTALKDGGKKTAILSNGEPSMLIAAAKSAGIYQLLDGILLDRDGRYIQAAPIDLSDRSGRPESRCRGYILSVIQRLGCAWGGRIRLPRRLGQPVRPAR